ncbi:nuclear transport factor 2 family protein [Pontibacillus yanchengensis]|uniref:DNA-binding protein n=1 Tax=Pontibacillus yanchengensis Y32 TaxID=1385514 RepID=A0A0A2TA46_9BACI|nr:hypothetical protein [Pontibacillus yanchengensis]KGP72399.1 DNA-binding protein [Pontibacillus yanchengensis Y32]
MEGNQEGLKIICAEDCGNSPKKEFLKQFTIAFSKGDLSFLEEAISNDIYWNILGNEVIEGKDQFIECCKHMKSDILSEVHMKTIITHGKSGAVEGMFNMKNQKRYAFCDMFQFTGAGKNAKIKELTSYVIEI